MAPLLYLLSLVGVFTTVSGVVVQETKEGKIVGGTPATEGEIPWQVAIYDTATNRLVCGGVLISGGSWVLTAASCFPSSDTEDIAKSIEVRAGLLQYDEDPVLYHREIKRKESVFHPSFDKYTMENDLVLLKLDTPFTEEQVIAAELPAQGTETIPGSIVQVSGWGYTSENGNLSPYLMKVNMPVISKEMCNSAYEPLRGGIPPNTICAGSMEGGLDSCTGDTGGPLTLKSDVTRLHGIVSWGNGCARPGFPGIYTEVAEFVDWIDGITKT